MKGRVVSVNLAPEKGTPKRPVPSITIGPLGVEGDAHAGRWHRQVSLLDEQDIASLSEELGRAIQPGELAENITIAGLDTAHVMVRDRLHIGGVALEVTQIGKECHGDGCSIFQAVGRCVMPLKGLFTRVIEGGAVQKGDAVLLEPRPLKVCVITLSDRASRGEYEDQSGPLIRKRLAEHCKGLRWRLDESAVLIPDDADALRRSVEEARSAGCDTLFTTGGTGIGPKDLTPDVIRPMLDKEIPGIMEYIRVTYGESIPSALLSRSVAGVMGRMLIYTLPGSLRAVEQYLSIILASFDHAILSIAGIEAHRK